MSTRAFAYTPGGHVAVVVWPVCVLCALPPADPRVAALYAALSEGATLESSLDLVAMTGISRLPPFAATVLDGDEARVVLHGAARARTSDGTVLEGTALLHESRVTMGSASLQLLIDDEVGLEGAWSIRNGIVAASSIGLTGGTDDAMDSAKRATTASVAGTGALPRRDAEAQATAGPGAPVAEAPMAAEQAVPAPDDAEEGSGPSGFDHLFGETIGLAPAAEEQPAAGQEPVQHHQSLGETQIGAPTVGLAEVGELAAGVASGLVEHPPAPAPGTGQGFIAAFDWRGASWPPP
ncbi:MAG: hypothetical protein FWC46_02780, partial [Actinomycetia bacterium]|nr:hypothetical protein [Actinomycetes bacterium]